MAWNAEEVNPRAIELAKIKRNKLFGRVSIFAGFMALFHVVKDSSLGLSAAPLIDLFIASVIFFGYYLYRRGQIIQARIIVLCFLNAIFVLYACLLPQTVGVYLFYFPLIAISAAVFDATEKKQRNFFITLSVCCLSVLFISDFKLLGDVHIQNEEAAIWFLVNLFSAVLILIVCIKFIIELNEETENQLHLLAKEVKTQNVILSKTNAELDRFLYCTSHDLRAPLMSIKGLVNIASNETTDPTLHKYFSMMIERADKLDAFIKDIIDYSRNSRTELVISEVNFSEIVDEVWNNFLFMEGAQNIRFIKNVLYHEPAYTDKGRLLVLLNNLVSNAIKYHNYDQAESWISVEVVGMLPNVKIVISDNGLGINKKHLDRVFDMFYRAHEYSKGSGLGLYIVKETIEKLNADIKVTSEERVGTTFTLMIPVNVKNTEQPTATPVTQPLEQVSNLIVEATNSTTSRQLVKV